MTTQDMRVALADLTVGGMKEVEDGGLKVLFVRDGAGVRAFEPRCPHYGGPLAKGVICNGVLYCPWHKAAFDIRDGALRQPPALNALRQYPVRVDGDFAVATLERLEPAPPAKRLQDKRFVVVGTGAAAVSAVLTLRREGFAGRIVMIGREGVQPYDRPNLSKKFLAEKTAPSSAYLEKDFYAAHDVEVVEGPALKIDPHARRVTLGGGRTVSGDALLIATGSAAVMPDFPGHDLPGVFTLRSIADAAAVSDAAEHACRVVLVGGGFIALEAAAFLTKRGLEAMVVSREELPLADRFGDEIAGAIKAFHESRKIRFLVAEVARFCGDQAVSEVHLQGGRVLEADMVLVAAGAKPETEIIDGVAKRADGGVAVDAALRVAPGCWLAGDIAAFPETRSGTLARIEHWRLAEQHGAHAARAMLGDTSPFTDAPFFWTNQGEKRVDYAGYAPEWERIIVHGDIKALDFIAYYISGGRALAACAVGRTPPLIAFLHALDRGEAPSADRLEREDLQAA